MSKVTSKLQVTIPKAIARQYGIEPGAEIEFRPAGAEIRVVPPRTERQRLAVAERLRLFDESTARARRRWPDRPPRDPSSGRGWTRDDLYARGSAPRPEGEDEPAPRDADEDPR
jgi:AbrB family looped-hinge helix DNA binding protein